MTDFGYREPARPAHSESGWLHAREVLAATAVLAVVMALAFPEVMFNGKTLLSGGAVAGVLGSDPPYGYDGEVPEDIFRVDRGASVWFAEPGLRSVQRAYGDGDPPLWNSNVGTGAPLLANMQSAPFNPLKIPPLVSPSPGMWDLYLLGRFLLGGIVALMFARLLGLALPGAIVVAVGYILSGHFMLYSNNHWLEVYFSLPLILLAVELVVRDARLFAAALLAAGVAFNLLAGMPEASFLTILLAGGYAAYRLMLCSVDAHDTTFALRRGALLSVGFVGGFALAAASLLPFLEYVANSFNTHTPDDQVGLRFDPPRFAITLLVPFFNGSPLENLQGTGWAGVRNYVGVVLPFLAVVGLWHRSLMRQAGWFFLTAVLLALLKTYGVPGVQELGRLPLANVTIFPGWIAPVAAFSIALLAGIGVDHIYRGNSSVWPLHFAGMVLLVVLVCLLLYNWDTLDDLRARERLWVGLAFVLVFGVWALLGLRRRLTDSWYLHAPAALAVGVVSFLILDFWGSSGDEWPIRTAIALGLVVTLWALLWWGRQQEGRQFAWACLAVVAAELLLFAPHGIYRDRYDTFSRPPYVEFLQSRQSEGEWPRVFALDALLYPNSASAFDLQDIRDLDALYPERFVKYVRAFVSPDVHDRFVGGPYGSNEDFAQVAGNPFFDLTGVKYVVTGPEGIARVLPNPIIDGVVSDVGSSAQINRTGFTIEGVEKPVLFAHPPADLTFQVTPTQEKHFLRFSLALRPASWSEAGDGVNFEVAIGESPASTVFTRWVDPKNNAGDRRWFDEELDLSPYIGQNVTVHFRTLPGVDSLYDWSGWGDPRLTGENNDQDGRTQFELVYDAEVLIYRNRYALPRAFAAHVVREAVDGDDALALMSKDDFDPSRVAVVEGPVPALIQTTTVEGGPTSASHVNITSYRDNRVELSASMDAPGLVLLTDTYYPGWKVYVDGERAELVRADFLFRGVFVLEGQHEIEFVYDPASFKIGLALSLAALLCLVTMTLIDLYRHRLKRRAADADGSGDENLTPRAPLI